VTLWRCPHCATPQPETARCWVCKRSSTSCGTCRHFRRSVALQLGYCGLDRRRLPLVGDEIRPCWEAGAGGVEESPADDAAVPAIARTFDFVPLGEALPGPAVIADGGERTSLWGDLPEP
jgi:hypothetical protein